ncbi:hypothetical protein FGK60_21820 [Streptomyces sp. DASNCL29]|nr:hypothetical protein FGK60_21820 [Streptomyces sp. DASNCL29]
MSAALDALAVPTEVVRSIAIAPLLVPAGDKGWDTSIPGEARKIGEDPVAKGVVGVTLPAGGRITGFRVFGSSTGVGTVRVDLMRRGLDGTSEAKIVQIVAPPNQSFPPARAPLPDNAEIDPKASYFIFAHVDEGASNDRIILTGFQVTYQEM